MRVSQNGACEKEARAQVRRHVGEDGKFKPLSPFRYLGRILVSPLRHSPPSPPPYLLAGTLMAGCPPQACFQFTWPRSFLSPPSLLPFVGSILGFFQSNPTKLVAAAIIAFLFSLANDGTGASGKRPVEITWQDFTTLLLESGKVGVHGVKVLCVCVCVACLEWRWPASHVMILRRKLCMFLKYRCHSAFS